MWLSIASRAVLRSSRGHITGQVSEAPTFRYRKAIPDWRGLICSWGTLYGSDDLVLELAQPILAEEHSSPMNPWKPGLPVKCLTACWISHSSERYRQSRIPELGSLALQSDRLGTWRLVCDVARFGTGPSQRSNPCATIGSKLHPQSSRRCASSYPQRKAAPYTLRSASCTGDPTLSGGSAHHRL